MNAKSMRFKTKVNNYAKQNKIPAQVVLQNIMFERLLDRLSKSSFKDKFILKGGVLISSLLGLSTRTTMDLDTTLTKMPLSEETVKTAITQICQIDLEDDISFQINSISPIRKDDIYGGYRVKLIAIFEKIKTPLSIDISTGDVITPKAVKYDFSGILDHSLTISLYGYNIETILAEKNWQKKQKPFSAEMFPGPDQGIITTFIFFKKICVLTKRYSMKLYRQPQSTEIRGNKSKIMMRFSIK